MFGILITPDDGSGDPERGLQAVHMPFVLDRFAGPYGTLAGHVARRQPGVADIRARSARCW